MKIIDVNILNKYLDGTIDLTIEDSVYVTDDLMDEIELLKLVKDSKEKLDNFNFKHISEHDSFNESEYYKNYKYFLNKYKKLVSFYSMKGIGDISILTAVKTILNKPIPSLFDSMNTIEVFTNDQGLKDALTEEFNTSVNILDPSLINE